MSKILIFLGVVFIIGFTMFSIILNLYFSPAVTTTTTTTTPSPSTVPTSTTTSTTKTTTSTTTTSSSTTITTTTTTQPVQCGSNPDCGDEYYSGTYFCNNDVVSLLKCKPRCVLGICKEKCEIEPIDKCGRNETCLPGRRFCVDEWEFENVTSILEIYPDRYVAGYKGYKFRLNYTVYSSPYETSAILIDVVKPDGMKTQMMSRWDIEGTIDDLEVGIYSIKRSSAVIWIQKS